MYYPPYYPGLLPLYAYCFDHPYFTLQFFFVLLGRSIDSPCTLIIFVLFYSSSTSSSSYSHIIDMHVCTVCLALCAYALEEYCNVYRAIANHVSSRGQVFAHIMLATYSEQHNLSGAEVARLWWMISGSTNCYFHPYFMHVTIFSTCYSSFFVALSGSLQVL